MWSSGSRASWRRPGSRSRSSSRRRAAAIRAQKDRPAAFFIWRASGSYGMCEGQTTVQGGFRAMIKLYHSAQSTNSRKVRIALIEKGLEFERVAVDLGKKEQKSPEY